MPRKPRGGLAAWLRDAHTPLYVVDARRVVLFFNQGCEELTGWSAADVVGRACDYASEPAAVGVDALTCALCPAPEAFAGRSVAMRAEVPTRTGELRSRVTLCTPLPGVDPGELRILCVCLPASDARDIADPLPAPSEWHAELARICHELNTESQFHHVVARSAVMRRVMDQLRLAVHAVSGVHLQGPPGSGREFLARSLHLQSPRRLRPFVPLDCAALKPFDLQRTLLRALASDASQDNVAPDLRPGTILLRNVTRMPRDVQQTLIELLANFDAEECTDLAVYSLDEVSLPAAVDREQLLPALSLRLSTLVIDVPALRDRSEDLPLLAQFFLERQNRLGDRDLSGFSGATLQQMNSYNWPGNVRELRLVIDEAYAAAAGPQVEVHDLPFRFRTGVDAQKTSPQREPQPLDLEAWLQALEAREIRRVLGECRQNRAQAARLLGLTRTKLYRRMQQLGLDSSADAAPAGEG